MIRAIFRGEKAMKRQAMLAAALALLLMPAIAGAGCAWILWEKTWLVENGYAMLMTVPPNVKHQELFLRLQREARGAGRGLWR